MNMNETVHAPVLQRGKIITPQEAMLVIAMCGSGSDRISPVQREDEFLNMFTIEMCYLSPVLGRLFTLRSSPD